MCALRPAFDARNFISLIYKIVKGDYEVSHLLFECIILWSNDLSLQPIPSMYSAELAELIKVILVKAPEDRPRYISQHI